jgi:hypothetical protein
VQSCDVDVFKEVLVTVDISYGCIHNHPSRTGVL